MKSMRIMWRHSFVEWERVKDGDLFCTISEAWVTVKNWGFVNFSFCEAVKGKQCGTCVTSCTGYWTTEYQRWRLWPNCMDIPKGKNLAKDYNGSRPLSIILTLPSTLCIFPMRILLTKSLRKVSLPLISEGFTGLRVLGIWPSLHVRNHFPANACLCG